MKKLIKMAIYGAPSSGKSTFASKAPNPFYITTDGNFSWLGLPKKNHTRITNFEQFKKIVELLISDSPYFAEFETIVVDLADDVVKYAENDFLKKNGLQYIGDMDYGKGYKIYRDSVEVEMLNKLISVEKNIIFILHEKNDTSEKDSRGNSLQKYVPIFDDKLLEKLEGRVQFFLRAYKRSVQIENDENNKMINKYYISLIPKANEYGIARNIDEMEVPDEIESDWETFATIVGANDVEEEEEEEEETELQKLIAGIAAPTKSKPVLRTSAQPTTSQASTTATATNTAKKTIVVKAAPKTEEVKTTVKDLKATIAKSKKVEEVKEAEATEVAEEVKEAEKVEAVEENIIKEVAEDPTIAELKEKAQKMKEIQPKTSEEVKEEKVETNPSISKANEAIAALLARKKAQNK